MVSVGSQVACTLIYSDNENYWLDMGAGQVSEDTTNQLYGLSCLKVNSSGNNQGPYVSWASINFDYQAVVLSIKGNIGNTIRIAFLLPDWSNVKKYEFAFNSTGWITLTIPLSSFSTMLGSPNWATSEGMYINSLTANVWYLDNMYFSNTSFLIVTDPIYATVTPTVGTHAYIEGQPVQISATMLLNYSFLKFSYSPVGVSTGNPMWLVMSENMTLNTIVVPLNPQAEMSVASGAASILPF